MSDMLSARELAQRLGVSDDTVYRRTASGEIPHFRVGPAIRYNWSEVYAQLHRGPSMLTTEASDEH